MNIDLAITATDAVINSDDHPIALWVIQINEAHLFNKPLIISTDNNNILCLLLNINSKYAQYTINVTVIMKFANQ